ncbi:hypothetical protein BTM25_08240 [Actinomadura rubteroloni]|uniref:Uncharacterized protein n=1 Tax=Actinomadura rubteroloni TaxID=1926885 RepID=A0A2P4UMZ7_9ACTN|nr:hypothetical protein [Actinomadura rubteroloni]POM26424.1 hypothetical protein BTM25_08240 [Actinomadura rubteroloni]
MTVLGVNAGLRDRSALEQMVLDVVPDPVLFCTHPGRGHQAASVELGTQDVESVVAAFVARGAAVALDDRIAGPDEHRPGAVAARAAHRRAGRAVRFPGQHLLCGTLTVEDAVATGAVDRVEPLGGPVPPGTPLVTHDFVRPVYRAGTLVLEVTPAAAGVIPFELEHQDLCGH